jgi:non-specific serine/threonine protein kinase
VLLVILDSRMYKEARAMPTMPELEPLHIHLLGEFRLASANAQISQVNSPRLQALLAYLVLHRDTPQSRQRLAFLLWPDSSEAQARTNLRQLIHALKQALPQADQFVHSDAQTLQWRPNAPYRLDVSEFTEVLAQADAPEEQNDLHAVRVALEQAIPLYGGDLLPSCYDDWIMPERERLRQAFTGALERLILLLEREGEPRAAIGYAQRLLHHDPLREETYRGLMRLYAQCGDRAGVARVYHTCETVLERELGVEPSPATHEAYELSLRVDVHAHSLTPAMPSVPQQPSKNNLPVQLTSFVAREREMAQAKQLLLSNRLLTLTGPGGTGKTRLGLQLASEVLETFAAGVWLVELAPLADPTLVTQTVATTLGVREQPGRAMLDALLDYVRHKTILIILDNCEHLIESCAQLAHTLLRTAPGLRILATSRESLGISGETSYRVPSLSLPDPRQRLDLDALAQNECMNLFVDRALEAYPPFRLTAKNAPAITQICLRLDGIPLAIELAAVRTKVFPPEQIAGRLNDRFRLLTGGSRTALERHQTLFALIEWSHNLLSEPERVLLRRLSVFAGGWSFEAAQEVCGDGLNDDVLDLLAHLANKSLVVVEGQIEAAEGRYRLLETIRQYARDKLLASGESEQVRERHLDYFLRFAEEAEPRLRSAEQLEWLGRVETEHDNMRTALAWALESGRSEGGLRLAGALYYFWELRGYWSEGGKWLDEALVLAEKEGHGKVAVGETYLPTRARTPQRAKALYGAARMRFGAQIDFAGSLAIVEESLRLWREIEDKWWMAVALEHVGFMLVMKDTQLAVSRLEEGVSLAREVEDRWPLAMCLVRLGGALAVIDSASARHIREEGVGVARSVGDRSVLSQGLEGLAPLYWVEENLTAAASVAEEALEDARAIGSVTQVFLSLFMLVGNSCLQGDLAKAKGYCLQIEALCRETGASQWRFLLLAAFGLVACFGREPGQGVRLLATGQTLLRQRGLDLSNIPGQGGPAFRILWQALDKARAQLDPAAFEAAWAEGQQMTLEQAIALATENEREDLPLPRAGHGSGSD